MAYKFAEEELAPHAEKWDRTKEFPLDVYKEAADLGFAGIYVREESGGCGLSRLESSLIFEALSTGCVGSSAYLSIHNMVAGMIDLYGT
jgi:alkylation response protein AidB-like acyl-CoA dehydrogenase